MCCETPQSRVAKAIYTLNHLTVPGRSQNPKILNYFLSLQLCGDAKSPRPKVMVMNIITNKWEGLWELVTWGHGYVCISMDTRTQWIPARCVHPALHCAQDQRQHPRDDPPADVEEQWLKQLAHLTHRELEFHEMTSLFKDFIYFYTSRFYTYLNVRTQRFWDRLKDSQEFSESKSWPCTGHRQKS